MTVERENDHLDLGRTLELLNIFYKACRNKASDPSWKDLPLFALFNHIIHMGRGAEVLLERRLVLPVAPLLRSMFEAYITLRLILERLSGDKAWKEKDKKRYRKRCDAWLCGCGFQETSKLELLLPDTKGGKALRKAIKEEFGRLKPTFSIYFAKPKEIQARIKAEQAFFLDRIPWEI